MLSMKDKVAIVTGAGSIGPGWGNGKATATLLARQGASVFLVDINESAAQETRQIIESEGGTCAVHRCGHDDCGRSAGVGAGLPEPLQAH
jgi:NAD(P)-dependent dehydrogenase (short-subunit alcohol dehydrogenase family)